MLRQAGEGGIAAAHAMAMASAIRPALCWRGMSTDIEELRGEIIALETALASAFGELAVLRASIQGGGAPAALLAMEEMAGQLEASLLRGVVGAEEAGRPGAAVGFERRMELIVHALRNAIAFRGT